MIDKNNVLSFVKERGPVLPRDISKEFGGDTFITGAILSQLTDNKEIKISHAKIGGSPVYYFSGQEEKLKILYNYLPGKEKEAYDLLYNKKIIRDNTAEPAIRVALRNIKDFAKALEVNVSGDKELFWKWFLLPNQEVEKIIRQVLGSKTEQEENSEKKEIKKEIIEGKNILEEDKSPSEKNIIKKEEIKKEQKIDEKKEEVQENLHKKEDIKDDFFFKLKKIFTEKNIEILETKIIRKNSDIEMEIIISSQVGKLKYFCKVRDKKKSNDKDLSSVFIQGQIKKLPILYVTTGDLTKKAEEMLEKEFKTISVLHI